MGLARAVGEELAVRLLVSGATKDVATAGANVGRLYVPKDRNPPVEDGRPHALDNGAFTGFDADAFVALLERHRGRPGCLFVAAPDVVGDAASTLRQFKPWAPMIRALGYPVALVAQDGLTVADVPWSELDAIFIGGSTAWKMSRAAESILGWAAARGKWRHVGRVNSRRRMRHFHGLADSVDGSGFSRFGKRIGFFEQWSRQIEASPRLPAL